ncbi:heat shock 70 kDa protein 12A-like [Ostrea edulis]|uniref:heat shock 70 kDa protein 12A-like n=1 Tax=Ostrea edulis TaxID=37623 RepID=UPI0024AF7D75|nr:heat shock 70 kDa protein 12A-like [Ostrea edulis]
MLRKIIPQTGCNPTEYTPKDFVRIFGTESLSDVSDLSGRDGKYTSMSSCRHSGTYPVSAQKSNDDDGVIEDENGKPMSVLTVFSESIRYLKDSLLEECRKHNTGVDVNILKWIIAVPALSSDPEKSLIWLAAIEAGIDPKKLILTRLLKEALFVAAIDFGTTYSGYAFSSIDDFNRDPTKAYLKEWVDPSSNLMYNKTSTCILFTKEMKFSHFGFEAEDKYSDLMENNDHKEWYFFRKFKMCLYDLKSCNENMIIEDETGKPMQALTVFSESIGYMKESLLEQCRKQNTDIELEDIKWVITVPAIWSDPAKSFMRLAAVEAGIDSEMLAIVLEPEAAAIYVKHIRVERTKDNELQTFAPGSKYIVVDAGGGTIDTTAHEVLEDHHVIELIRATGGDWGGTSVDESYMNFIKCIIGDSVTDKIVQDQSNVFYEICREFEIAKRRIRPDSDTRFTVKIPSELSTTYKTVTDGELNSITSGSMKNKGQVGVRFTLDKIRLGSKDAQCFFADSISNICRHLSYLFEQEAGKGITTIILVGGYAESPVLINAIKSKFPQMRTIIPQEAAWSVLRGAVIFGHDPSLIKQRRSKYTYGIGVYKLFDPSKHDEKYRYEEDGEVRCGSLFSKLIEIDQLVTVGEYQKEEGYILRKIGSKGNLSLYSSTSENPKYIDEDGCSFIGYILPPGHKFLINEDTTVNMCFGETEIEFKAHQPKSQLTATYHLGQ